MTTILLDVPSIPFPGSRTDAHFYQTVARNLRGGFPVGGSNVTEAVCLLLERTAEGLDEPVESEAVAIRELRSRVARETAIGEAFRHAAATTAQAFAGEVAALRAALLTLEGRPGVECSAKHPTNTSIVPCMLPPGHDSRAPHWSTSGCSGGACVWFDEAPDHLPGWVVS